MRDPAGYPIHTANPSASYRAHKQEIDAAIEAALEGAAHALGPVVERFEAAFAQSIGVPHAVGVNSGTDALHLALRALGVGKGDEVITVSHTAVASVAAVEMSGAEPVLVDVELPWFTIDPEAAAAAVGPRTKAVLAVHLYGHPADLTALRELCTSHGIALIEDCAQAQGAAWCGQPVGVFGDAACFSFYPTKNLGTVGDGGLVATGDPELARRVAMLRQYGWTETRESLMPGWNSRLGVLEAAILEVKLRHLPAMIRARRRIAELYGSGLGDLALTLPRERTGARHTFALYVCCCRDATQRDALVRHLADHRIIAGIHYPVPVHLQPAYRGRLDTRPLRNTERVAQEVISLPMYPELTADQQETVIIEVRRFFGESP